MDIVLDYYGFSSFTKDESQAFNGNDISHFALNNHHALVFEREDENTFHLHITKFSNLKDLGNKQPEILETIVENYDKSKPEHRLALRAYVD